ncbi:MAG TPA: hypothetical protein VIV40_38280 [Kofleriaceae bacterium]
MAAKKTKPTPKLKASKSKAMAKPTPKRTASKSKAKPVAKSKAAAAKQAPRAQPKPTPKAKALNKRASTAPTAVSPKPVPAVEEVPAAETATVATKKGRLARIAGGVGSLIARMTGKKTSPHDEASDESAASRDSASHLSPDATMELASGDIMTMPEGPPPIPKPKS